MAGGADGKAAPSGTLEAEVIHKDGSKESVHPIVPILRWLKGLFNA